MRDLTELPNVTAGEPSEDKVSDAIECLIHLLINNWFVWCDCRGVPKPPRAWTPRAELESLSDRMRARRSGNAKEGKSLQIKATEHHLEDEKDEFLLQRIMTYIGTKELPGSVPLMKTRRLTTQQEMCRDRQSSFEVLINRRKPHHPNFLSGFHQLRKLNWHYSMHNEKHHQSELLLLNAKENDGMDADDGSSGDLEKPIIHTS